MKRIIILIISLFHIWLNVFPNSFTLLRQYSEKDGLSEINVTCMLQDRKGLMWFGTYDGLNMFNGYNFKTYKNNSGNSFGLLDYRVDQIKEDAAGLLWVLTYDGRAYNFNQHEERFTALPQAFTEYRKYKPKFDNIYTFSDGAVWLSGKTDGCFKIIRTSDNEFKTIHFEERSGQLSSNIVNEIYSDKKQNIWILTDNGLNFIKTGKDVVKQLFKEKNHGAFYSISEYQDYIWIGGDFGKVKLYNSKNESFELINFPATSQVIGVVQYCKNELFVLTRRDGFFIYNLDKKKIEQSFNTRNSNLQNTDFYSCYQDKNRNIWIESANPSVVYFQTKEKRINNFDVTAILNKQIIPLRFFVIEDKFGNIWVHPRMGGFSLFNKTSNKLEQPYGLLNSVDIKFSNIIHFAYSDRQGNMWLSPYSHALKKMVFVKSPFTFHKANANEIATSSNEIRSLFQDNEGQIWAGAKNGVINVYDRKHVKFGTLNEDGSIGAGSPVKITAYSLMEDSKKRIWIGSKGAGLYRLTKTISNKYFIERFTYNPDDIYSLSNDNVYSIAEDHFGRIWVGTYGGGINLLDEKEGKLQFISVRNKLTNYPIDRCNRARHIIEDSHGNMFVGTTGGLLVYKTPKNITDNINFKHVMYNPENPNSISGNDVHNVLPSKDGKLYLAIFGGGLNVLDQPFDFQNENKFRSYMVSNGAPSNVFYTVREDNQHNIWFSTETSVGKFIPKDEMFETYKPLNDNAYVFMEGVVLRTTANEMAYGTSEGYMTFNISKPLNAGFVPKIVFTDFQLFNKSVEVGVEGSPLKKVIDETTELKLTHKQNVFSISFAALDFSNIENIQYAYKLDGFDKEWNYVHTKHVATYTNLPKGKYVFRVKSTNSDGAWIDNERSIVIVRKPSFWESGFGYLFYFLMFIGIILLTTFILYKFFVMKKNVELEHTLTNMKLKFFTDISHELRTPLTLITTPVENVLNTEPLSEGAKKQLTLVQKNVDRMLRLITQILDFRKIQNNKMKLQPEPIHAASFLCEIIQNFQAESERKSVDFLLKDHTNDAVVWADKDKFEKIFYNLFSNALKFSNANGQIRIDISETKDFMIISVSDKGVGIASDKLKYLFNRFESFVNSASSIQQGTGIGLSLTKELVELHQGAIEVESEQGKGTRFKVSLPTRNIYVAENEDILNNLKKTSAVQESDKLLNEDSFISDKQQILIVEDNAELREFLASILIDKFDVLEAENGKQALVILQNDIPDIIITDFMMPEMDGIAFSKIVKDDIRTSHIPVIMLTARTDMDVKLEALDYGVDDYITKPFSAAYLKARVDNLLRLRKQLQELYRTSLTPGAQYTSHIKTDSKDAVFIQKIKTFIDANIENSELTIDEIAAHLALGRSTFFKKLKSMIGISPVEFLKDYRIQRAADLIVSTDLNFSEISFQVGFNDLSYFSRSFKQKFGMSPSEYRDNALK